jgi:hypothetical protein
MGLRDIGAVKDTATAILIDPRDSKPLLHADGTEMTVTLYGPFSATYKSVMREQQQRRVAAATGDTMTALTDTEIESYMNELTRRCIAGWDITLEGEDRLEFTPENVDMVFAEFPWLYDQCAAVLGRTAGFFDSPKTA